MISLQKGTVSEENAVVKRVNVHSFSVLRLYHYRWGHKSHGEKRSLIDTYLKSLEMRSVCF